MSIKLNYSKYLIAGATGGSGIELVNLLLAKGKSVTIIVRNKTKAKSIFKENYEKIDRVIECELGSSQLKCQVEYSQELIEGLNWCEVLVSALGTPYGSNPQQCDYTAAVDLISHCLHSENKFSDKLLVYISTMYITRPKSFVALMLNYLMANVMGWKALAENRIRQSGLNYLIVRPGRLSDAKQLKTVEIHQGDTTKGGISRLNLANFILHSLTDGQVNKGRVTVEVVEKTIHSGAIECSKPVRVDDDKSIITADHFVTNRNLVLIIYTILTLLFLMIVWKLK